MTPLVFRALVVGLLTGGTLSLSIGAGSYRRNRLVLARAATAGGFITFAIVLILGTTQYMTNGRSFRVLAIPLSVIVILFCVHAIELVRRQWHRTEQLATVVATFLVLLLPFELVPSLHVVAQEWYAAQAVRVLQIAGAQPTLESTTVGDQILIAFRNGFHLKVVRECNAVYASALFTAIAVGARTTLVKKLGVVGFALAAVLIVNLFRIVFVGLAVANNWFGPLVTDTSTIQMSYYVAELGIGQSIVIVAIVGGFFIVGRWVPDVLAFITELASTVENYTTGWYFFKN